MNVLDDLDRPIDGLRLRQAREGAGLSQERAAVALGVGVASVRRWEADGSPAKRLHAMALAALYGVSFESLLAEAA